MGYLGLELNDAAVALALPGGRTVESPGYVLEDQTGLHVGDAAARRARISPRQVNCQFWARLDTAPLVRPLGRARTAADLAAMHLGHLWEQAGAPTDPVVVAVPGSPARERLGLLLGITEVLGISVAGLVSAPLAVAPRGDGAPRRTVYVDAELHRVSIGVVEGRDEIALSASETLDDVGLVALREVLAKALGARFVTETRFDPLHHGDTEQALYDGLEGWLEALAQVDEIRVELLSGKGVRHGIRVTRAAVAEAVRPAVSRIAAGVAGAATPGPARVLLSRRVARLPGLVAALAELPEIEVETLAPGEAARGALARAELIQAHGGPRRLTVRLGPPSQAHPLVRPPTGAPPAEPTHLVVEGIAHRLEGLAPELDPGLVRDGPGLWIEPAPELLVNGRPVAERRRVLAGDRIRAPGRSDELLLAALAP